MVLFKRRNSGSINGFYISDALLLRLLIIMNWHTLRYDEEFIERFWSKVQHGADCECWLWRAALLHGYGYTSYRYKTLRAHRVAYVLSYGIDLQEDQCVCHSCDNPACVNPNHLWVGTHADNVRDKVQKGRQRALSGEQNPNTRLSDHDIRQIRQLYEEGISQKELAALFEISQPYVSRLVNGKRRIETKEISHLTDLRI